MTDRQAVPGSPDPAVPPPLPLLLPGDLDAAQRALYTAITTGSRARAAEIVPLVDGLGRLSGPFNALLYAPHLGEALQEVGARIRNGLSLSSRERELATLLVAGHARSAYELSAHRLLAAAAGVTPREIERAAAGAVPGLEDSRERRVAEFCAMLLTGAPPAQATADAVSHLGARAVVELVVLVGYYQLLARLLDVAGAGGDADADGAGAGTAGVIGGSADGGSADGGSADGDG